MAKPAGTSSPETEQRIEQRQEPRSAAGDDVYFLFGDAVRQVQGRLLDRSASGFRAEHDCTELTCGQMVQFHIQASTRGQARVVWTRILGARVETGFFIVA